MPLRLCRCRVVRFCTTVDIVRDGGATSASGRVRSGHCLGTRPSRIGTAERSHSLCNHLERPRRQRGKCRGQLRAAVGCGVYWCMPLAREHDGDEHLEPLHTSAWVSIILCCGPALVRSGVHMQRSLSAWRRVPGLNSRTAQHSPLRGYSTDTQWCSAVVSQWLGGVRSGAPVHAQRTPAQRTAHRSLPRDDDACGIGRAIHSYAAPSTEWFARSSRKQTNKQTNKQTTKQTTKQPNKQTTIQTNKKRRTEQDEDQAAASRCARATRSRNRCSIRATCAHLRRCGVP